MTEMAAAHHTAGFPWVPRVRAEVGVVQKAFLGDVLLSIPLLHRLGQLGCRVTLLTHPVGKDLVRLFLTPEQLHIETLGRSRLGVLRPYHTLRLWKEYRRRFDVVVALHRGVETSLLAPSMAKLYSLGFDSAELGWFYDQILPRTWGEHELSKNAGFVQALFGTPWKPQAGWGKALFDSALESQPCISEPPGFGILHPGSRWATKRWDKYPELLEALLSNSARLSPWNRLRWVITGDSEDQNLFGGHFARFEGNPRVDVRLGRVSLREFLGLCRRASLMMTNDSFPTHVAGCFDVPCLTVFGPTVPAQGFGPSSTQSAVVERTELGCRPCGAHGHRRCPLSHFGCMKQISVDQVLSVLETLPIQGQNGTGP